MASDTYQTIRCLSTGVYKEKGSRFIASAFPVSDQEEIKTIVAQTRKEHHGARHHCYAYMLGAERLSWRINDDGEPPGTAGRSILGQINAFNLTNILIVVSRYFGGTLLGVSGLIRAYKRAADEAIKNNEIVEHVLQDVVKITFPYISINDVMKIIKEEDIVHYSRKFESECSMKIRFRSSERDKVMGRLSRVDGLVSIFAESG